tara:strand:+ start:1406 stop:2872 length:1467 start_codon:yes stop_codon:yes gene_type:complete
MEKKKYIFGSLFIFIVTLIIYKYKNKNKFTTKTYNDNDDFKSILKDLNKLMKYENKNKKVITKQLKEITNLNKLQIKHMKDVTNKNLFNKNIEKHRLFIDTHNINSEPLDRSNYIYYLSGSSEYGITNETGGYSEFKNVIGFRLVKAIIPNTNHVILDTRNTIIIELGSEFYNYKGSTNTSESDPGNGYIKFNNSTITSATKAYISKTTSLDKNINSILDGNTFLRIENDNNSSKYINFSISSVSVDDEGANYRTLNITKIGTSSFSLSDNDDLKVYLLKLNNINDRDKKIKIILPTGFYTTDTMKNAFNTAVYSWSGESGTSTANTYTISVTFDYQKKHFTFTMANNYEFKFKWTETNINSAQTVLGFINKDTSNFSNVINGDIPPDMSINYIDLIIDEIPSIACKYNAKGHKLIDRIGITSGLGELLEYTQKWDKDNENYFYPIKLNQLSIKLLESSHNHYYKSDRDHSFEFEITIIKNTGDFNLN